MNDTQHKVEFDVDAPNRFAPWKVTMDNGLRVWHEFTEEAALESLVAEVRRAKVNLGLAGPDAEKELGARFGLSRLEAHRLLARAANYGHADFEADPTRDDSGRTYRLVYDASRYRVPEPART